MLLVIAQPCQLNFYFTKCIEDLPCTCIENSKIRTRIMESVWSIKNSSTSHYIAANPASERWKLFPYTNTCCYRNKARRDLWITLPSCTTFKIKALMNNEQALSSPDLKTLNFCDAKNRNDRHLKMMLQKCTERYHRCWMLFPVQWLNWPANVQLSCNELPVRMSDENKSWEWAVENLIKIKLFFFFFFWDT